MVNHLIKIEHYLKHPKERQKLLLGLGDRCLHIKSVPSRIVQGTFFSNKMLVIIVFLVDCYIG